ncbi:Phosphate starvation-inducible protein PhoH, predicted ATPase [hydrothermal vent metagenome]|uniref:PhoH-like protein n=1 Tax=hydrothermal vent metagenome TaxID=652676 RepID=A0A3B0VBW5_9ZZZZ
MATRKKDLKQITLGDNNFAMEFFGKGGDNLKRLEKKLGVEIDSRGTRLTIQGESAKVALAERLILELYAMVESGFTLTAPDVDYAIRMVVTDQNVRLKDVFMDTVALSYRKRSITPKSIAQKNYLDAIRSHDIVFGIGPAGTGKTYLAMAAAVAALTEKEVDRIILVRPAVEAGEKLGFLPGDMMAKVDPYLRPLYDALHDMMDIERAEQLIERGTIEVAPLAFMRGRTLNDSFVIMDEAQNTTREQMKMFLTRLGFSSKAVITGDITQIDLPLARSSGLVEAQKILAGIEGIDFVSFTDADVVRHPLVQKIIKAFEKADKNKEVVSD